MSLSFHYKEILTASGASGGVYIVLGSVLAMIVLILSIMAIIIIILVKKGTRNMTLLLYIILDGTTIEPL